MNEFVSIQLDGEGSPLYVQLFEAIEKLIIERKLTQGSKLPPIRKLAQQLKVNNVTVVNAYKLLEQKGYVHSKKGSGTYVAWNGTCVGSWDDFSGQDSTDVSMHDDIYMEEDIRLMSRGHIALTDNSINFASATPTPDLFPVDDFKQVLVEVLERDGGHAFGYDESNGYRPLRHAISAFLRAGYGIRTQPDNIQIISGAQQGIDIIAKALVSPGDYILVENPTYTGAIAAFQSRGAKIIGVPMQRDGVNMELLEKYIRIYRPRLMYTMPNYQNPTTYCYSETKKRELLSLAYKNNLYIIEDDFLSDLNFSENRKRFPLKVLDEQERVIYIKSFSKVLMPGLRIGFLIAPLKVYKKILQAKHTTDIASSGLIQRAFDLYLRKEIWGNHLEYMRGIYKERYEKVLKEIAVLERLGVEIFQPGGGLNIWLTLPKGISGTQLYQECVKWDVLFVPGKIFYIGNTAKNDRYIRLSFAAVYPHQIEKGIEVVYDCMCRLKNKGEKTEIYYSPLI